MQADWLRSGDVGALGQFAQESVRAWSAAEPLFAVLANSLVALVRLEGGAHLDPADILDNATEQAGYESWRDVFVDGLATMGDRAAAAALYPQCAPAGVRGIVHSNGHPFECAAGIAAACDERWEVTEAHFERALREVSAMRFVVSEIDVRRWHAWMLLARGAPGDVVHARNARTRRGRLASPRYAVAAAAPRSAGARRRAVAATPSRLQQILDLHR